MADDDDHEIGRQIIGAMRREVEAANRTVIVDFQEGTEQLAFAAARAAAAKAALQGGPDVALPGEPSPARPGFRHRLHDLPRLPPLPALSDFFSGLRVSLGLRPGLL